MKICEISYWDCLWRTTANTISKCVDKSIHNNSWEHVGTSVYYSSISIRDVIYSSMEMEINGNGEKGAT